MNADAEPNKNHPDGERSPPSTKISALLLACTVLLVPGKALVTLISQPASLPTGSSTGMTRGNLSDTTKKPVCLRGHMHIY